MRQDEGEGGPVGVGCWLGECCLSSELGKDPDNVGQVTLVRWVPSEQWAAQQSLWAPPGLGPMPLSGDPCERSLT